MTFELETDDGLCTVSQLAKRLNCSDQTVYNLESMGMKPVKTSADGAKLWDPAAAAEFREKHAPEMRHGGKREGAGRKKKDPDEAGGAETMTAMFDRAVAIRDAVGSGPIDLESAYGEQILERAMKGDVPRAEVITLKEAVEIRTALLEYRRREGSMVDAEAVRTAVGQHLRTVRTAVEGLAARVAPELVAEFKLPTTEQARVKRFLAEQVRYIMRQIAAVPIATIASSSAAHAPIDSAVEGDAETPPKTSPDTSENT